MIVADWIVSRAELNETQVGCDFYPDLGPDTCFRYEFNIPEGQWFEQGPTTTIHWLSIAALYDTPPCRCSADFDADGDVDDDDEAIFWDCVPPFIGPCIWIDLDCDGDRDGDDYDIFDCQYLAGWPDPACCVDPPQASHVWGWKTRLRDPDSPVPDNAVRIWEPYEGEYQYGEPIERPGGVSWDTAFVLAVPPPGPIPAVSEWGVVAMTLLVLTAGTLVFMRRRPARVS